MVEAHSESLSSHGELLGCFGQGVLAKEFEIALFVTRELTLLPIQPNTQTQEEAAA